VDDPGGGRPGQVAQGGGVERRLPPVGQHQALLRRRGGHRGPRVVPPDEQDGDAGALAEQRRRDRGEQSRAVGRPRVGGHGAPVLDAGQATERGGDDRTGRATLGVGDEADAAGVELAGRGGEHGAVLLPDAGRRGTAGGWGPGHGPVGGVAGRVPAPRVGHCVEGHPRRH
jgi:hypothetical protein